MKIEVSEDGAFSSKAKILVDGVPVGFVDRIRIDVDKDEVVPSVEVQLLRGQPMNLVSDNVAEAAKKNFELLRKVPGIKAVMPAPR